MPLSSNLKSIWLKMDSQHLVVTTGLVSQPKTYPYRRISNPLNLCSWRGVDGRGRRGGVLGLYGGGRCGEGTQLAKSPTATPKHK